VLYKFICLCFYFWQPQYYLPSCQTLTGESQKAVHYYCRLHLYLCLLLTSVVIAHSRCVLKTAISPMVPLSPGCTPDTSSIVSGVLNCANCVYFHKWTFMSASCHNSTGEPHFHTCSTAQYRCSLENHTSTPVARHNTGVHCCYTRSTGEPHFHTCSTAQYRCSLLLHQVHWRTTLPHL